MKRVTANENIVEKRAQSPSGNVLATPKPARQSQFFLARSQQKRVITTKKQFPADDLDKLSASKITAIEAENRRRNEVHAIEMQVKAKDLQMKEVQLQMKKKQLEFWSVLSQQCSAAPMSVPQLAAVGSAIEKICANGDDVDITEA